MARDFPAYSTDIQHPLRSRIGRSLLQHLGELHPSGLTFITLIIPSTPAETARLDYTERIKQEATVGVWGGEVV